jgi:CheY-like chemotaxis protein
MRFVSDTEELDLFAVINAVRNNTDSWKNWRCVKFEILAQGRLRQWKTLSVGIRRILEIYLQGKHGTAYMGFCDSIVVFCKDAPQNLLETMGRQIVDLVKSEINAGAIFRVYELHDDMDAFLSSFGQSEPRAGTENAREEQLSFVLPEVRHTKSDCLSRINGLKVLLVEDDPVTRWMVKMALTDQCHLTVASDANKALVAYQNMKPDMVLLDINLPGRNGHEVMERIMNCDPAAHIVMFSAEDSFETMVKCMASGARGFVAKPFNKERLIACVQNCRYAT